MRILHLAKYYWPRSGGMERVVQGLAEGAAALGHQVEVVAVESRGKAGSPGRQRSSVTRAFSFAALGSQEIAPGYIAAAWKRADVIHVHHPHPITILFAKQRHRTLLTRVLIGRHVCRRFRVRADLLIDELLHLDHLSRADGLEMTEVKAQVRWRDLRSLLCDVHPQHLP